MPPQHGKSTLAIEHFVSWYLGENPTHRIQIASYAASLAHEWSLKTRERFREWAPAIHDVGLSRDRSTMGDWKTTAGGGVLAAGVDGGFTGRGSNGGIVDDPIKNWQEAQSKTAKDHAWDWFLSSFVTRLAPDGWIIIVQTRWAKDDVAGRAMALWDKTGKEYTRIHLPAIAEENDQLGRKVGEPLWPEGGRDLAFYADRKAEVGPIMWAPLFQQDVTQAIGSMFRGPFRYFRIQGDFFIHEGTYTRIRDCRIFGVVDLASSTKDSASYTVIATFARSPVNDLFWIDVDRDHIPTTEQLDRLWRAAKKFHQKFILIEAVQYQSSFVKAAVQAGLPAIPIVPDADKVTRAIPLATAYYNGKVFHLQGAPWVEKLEAELLSFPDGETKDQVDVGAYAQISVVEQGAAPAGVYVPR